jgi:hypothetical protein
MELPWQKDARRGTGQAARWLALCRTVLITINPTPPRVNTECVIFEKLISRVKAETS